jgi:hypothetical protein
MYRRRACNHEQPPQARMIEHLICRKALGLITCIIAGDIIV